MLVHNLFFTGHFPDLISLLPPPRSGLTGCHSKTIIRSFLEGATPEAAVDAFLRLGETHDMKASWETSLHQFRHRQKAVDVPFDVELTSYMRQRRCFHTYNHPDGFLLARYAEKFLAEVLDMRDVDLSGALPDPLGWHGTWPVVPSVSERLSLPYASDEFVIPRRLGGAHMSFHDYILEAYGFYEQADRSKLVAAVAA
jgi:hypothetical protein